MLLGKHCISSTAAGRLVFSNSALGKGCSVLSNLLQGLWVHGGKPVWVAKYCEQGTEHPWNRDVGILEMCPVKKSFRSNSYKKLF